MVEFYKIKSNFKEIYVYFANHDVYKVNLKQIDLCINQQDA